MTTPVYGVQGLGLDDAMSKNEVNGAGCGQIQEKVAVLGIAAAGIPIITEAIVVLMKRSLAARFCLLAAEKDIDLSHVKAMASPRAGQNGSTHSLIGNASSMPVPVLSYNTAGQPGHSGERLDASPPATPRQGLLEPEQSGAQYATYRDDKGGGNGHVAAEESSSVDPKWLPWPLRPWFWGPLVVVLVLGAIGLEIALHFSNKNQGWESSGDISSSQDALHYVYTLPPVIVAAVLAAMWTWTDIEVKKMQPYVDLVHGNSPPHRSLLLDYTRYNNFFVWSRAAANKHYLVVLTSLMALLALSFQPLASALLAVRNTWMPQPGINVFNHRAIGLNQNNQFNDLTAFLTASGYAGASVLYNLGDPPFIHQGYTVGLFDLPSFVANNGSVLANTTAIKSIPGCVPVSVDMVQQGTTGWNNSVTTSGCSISWFVDHNATTLFGTDTVNCTTDNPPQFKPIIFWFFTYATSPPQSSATFCTPRIELWDVQATADISTGNITDPDEFVGSRLQALRLQLPAAVFQAAVQSPEGIIGSFDANRFVNLATRVYTTYLALVASTVYFLPSTEPITVEVRSFQQRVWLSDVAVHLLTTAMLLLALFATLIHLFHRHDRRLLRLKHEPGTIASAVSIGAQTGMGDLLAGRQRAEEMDRILRGKRFRIDPQTMKIIMEGEDGYEMAASPMDRRRSVFAALQNARPRSQWFSTQHPGTPKSPGSPLARQDGV
ncbi:hypothetical protein NP233_g10916 [Leucocoprinus birnbaumii]|uniref:Uncharacterized protein n=1 Tax=Leucocoprinus birnbaumii TaxID=56174 RepID=A0AAD5YLR2_9AGAR|nr:hypothetical protein NP233_g10916 [Leucocoprinus birnbaumii]